MLDNSIGGNSIEKSETIHVRASPELKKEAEGVFDELGVSTSYSVSMFLKQVVLERRIPFEIALPDEEEARRTEEFAIAFNRMGGKDMPESLKPILHLCAKGIIDYETACLIVSRKFQGSKP